MIGRNANIFNTIQDESAKRGAPPLQKVKKERTTTIPPESFFNLSSGETLKSLYDLQDALEDMNMEVWSHHVQEGRNDFANWIEFVFKNKKLADLTRGTYSPKELFGILSGPRL